MSDPLELEFPFTDLSITLGGKTFDGMLLSGEATLCGDDDWFYVRYIQLSDGPLLRRGGNGALGLPSAFEDEFFKRIAAVIENPKTAIGGSAEAFWSSHVEDYYGAESQSAAQADYQRSLAHG